MFPALLGKSSSSRRAVASSKRHTAWLDRENNSTIWSVALTKQFGTNGGSRPSTDGPTSTDGLAMAGYSWILGSIKLVTVLPFIKATP